MKRYGTDTEMKAEFSLETEDPCNIDKKKKGNQKSCSIDKMIQKGVIVCEVVQVQPCRVSSVVERGATAERFDGVGGA